MIASFFKKSFALYDLGTVIGLVSLLLICCSMQAMAAPTQLPTIGGTIMTGETPIAGSNVILWETDPGNTGYGLTATQLATATGSKPGGNFSFSTGYFCTPGQFVYITSTGGDVSNGSGIINNNAVLIVALGSCSNLGSVPAQNSVNVIVNELSTVAAAYTLDNFMSVTASTTGDQLVYIGAPANNNAATGACVGTGTAMRCTAAGLSHAFSNAVNLVDDVRFDGSSPTGAAWTTIPGNSLGSVPQAEINTLGDIVQYCTNSAGGVAGDSSNCGNLFADATSPTGNVPADTLSALLNIAKNPRNNVGTCTKGSTSGGLFCLLPSTPAFLPVLKFGVHDWSLAIAYSGAVVSGAFDSFGVPQYLTLDANDNVYVMTSDNYTPTMTGMAAMTSSGTGVWSNAMSTEQCIGGTLATDTNGYVWESIAEGATTPACPYAIYGYSEASGGTAAYSFTSSTTQAIQSTPNAIAFDRLGNLWYGRRYISCTNCLFELPYTSDTYGAPINIQNSMPSINQIVIDATDNIWVSNVATSSNGSVYVLPNTSPSTPDTPTYTATSGFVTTLLPATNNGGIALDSAGNIWTGSDHIVSEFTPALTGGVVTSFGSPTNTATLGARHFPGEVDGAGLYWYSVYAGGGNIYFQITPSSPLYSSTPPSDTNGALLPCYVPNGTTTCNGTLPSGVVASGFPRVAQVDSAGALWVASLESTTATNGFVLQIFGAAAPIWPQLSYGVSNPVTLPILTITASSASIAYGAAVPTITPTYSGFVSGDTPASLTTQPQCSTTAATGSPVGIYTTSCTGAADPNYNIVYVTGTLTLTPAPLTITADSASIFYGGTVPAVTPVYNGFVNGDTSASLTTQPECTTSASSDSLGTYPSSCSGADDSNYTIAYVDGSITVAANAVVDFSQPVVVQESMSGLLHGVTLANLPPSSLVTPLAPHLWRGDLSPTYDAYQAIQTYGLTSTTWDALLSDTYGYPGGGGVSKGWSTTGATSPPYDNAPYENNFALWDQTVTNIASTYGSRTNAIWEPWNEPDTVNSKIPLTNKYWYGTAQQFYQTYLAAYQTLRANLGPNALIVGPSPGSYDPTFISGLLDFCLANDCQVNVLSWHEFNDANIPGVATDIQNARSSFLNNPTYAPLNIQKIYINETVGNSADYEPGDILGYLYFLEQGGADAAAKACWPDPSGVTGCFDDSLDGLIDPATFQPRAPWWVYKLYTDGVSTRVPVSYANDNIVALASTGSASAQTAQILVGYFKYGNPPSSANIAVSVTNLCSLNFLRGLTQVQVQIQKIPNTGTQDLPALTQISTIQLPVQNNSIVVPINSIQLHELYVISISP